MRKSTFALSTALACMAVFVAPSARSTEVLVAGSGTWGTLQDYENTPYSVSNENFSFSFDLPNPIATNPTTQATNFVYILNDVVVAATLSNVQFFSAGEGGFFSLDFADGHNIDLYNTTDVGSSLTLSIGSWSTFAAIDGGTVGTIGTGTVTISAASAVPEPTPLAMLGAGIVGFGVLRRRRTQFAVS
jgi:hypothetical protein